MPLPLRDNQVSDDNIESIIDNAQPATDFLKALAHEGRLMILCRLATGEKSVTELEALLSARQAAVSQQLARLRLEGLVSHRREGKTVYYSLCDPNAVRMLELLSDMFCKESDAKSEAATGTRT